MSVDTALTKFKDVMAASFVRRSSFIMIVKMVFNRATYSASAVERQLKGLFSEEAKLYDPPKSLSRSPPNVAVTTVTQQALAPHIITN